MEDAPPPRQAVPAVVAVVVSRDPGPWFRRSLEALADQDYPNLAVLVVDAGSAVDVTPMVHEVLPGAAVRRLGANPGFGAAANEVSSMVDGAAFYCFLHDDSAPEPDAIGILVGEALRSNAGVVGAKVVDWDDRRRLLAVGEGVDKTGERVSLVEPGELDQEQHDAVRDVFVVPTAAMLVRSDLFDAIGGFDPEIDLVNDDLDLCWRVHVAGARVVVAPDAVVAHREEIGERTPDDGISLDERRIRHRISTMLSCYGRLHRWRVVPQAVLVSILEVVVSTITRRRRHAAEVVGAWRWNLARRADIAARRERIEELRTVPDAEIRRLQVRGSARITRYLQGSSTGPSRGDQAQALVQRGLDGIRTGELRWPIAAWLVTACVVGFGSRHLLRQPIPAVGGFLPFDEGPLDLFRTYLSGWREVGLGVEAPAPTALALLGLAGTALLGAMAQLRTLVILGSVVAGLVGAYRVLRPTGSPRAQSAALVVYGAIPLAYDAIAEARLGALVVYGTAPWFFAAVARRSGWAPFAHAGATSSPFAAASGLALGTAVVAAFEPGVLVVVVTMALGLALGSVLVSGVLGIPRLAASIGIALATAVVLHVPWSFEFFLPGATWDTVVGPDGATVSSSFAELLRFDVGPVGAGTLSMGLPLAGLLPLLIGREWRFDWAVRCWSVTLVGVALAWADGRDLLPIGLPGPGLLLAPAAVALAMAVGLGVIAFERDLRAYGFGWRQGAAAVAGAALLLGALPTLLDVGNGRWYLPSAGLDNTFAFLDDAAPGSRVLWVGDPVVVPVPGYSLGDGVVYATTTDGLPSIVDAWPGAPQGSTELIADALAVASRGETARLGRLLAPMAIEYVVFPNAAAPRPAAGVARPAPAHLLEALSRQLDMAEVAVNPAFVVYRNEASLASPALAAPGAGDHGSLQATAEDLDGAIPALVEGGARSRRGTLQGAGRVLHAVPDTDGWSLQVGGESVERVKTFGWASGYEVTAGGEATLRYRTDPARYLLVAIQVALWATTLLSLRRFTRGWRSRRRRRPAGDDGSSYVAGEVES